MSTNKSTLTTMEKWVVSRIRHAEKHGALVIVSPRNDKSGWYHGDFWVHPKTANSLRNKDIVDISWSGMFGDNVYVNLKECL